ncbi:diguanylate cyclase domain-containing protein [Marinobacter sp. JSM 1782161]|uniref:diguanylate cyclase domain-containing protein n=1 Tax=Marinobacter sp. JSM 1782161 TaxID=2685906 RepID=UPI0014037609|nr:diguanylate cyclase [Marinobacter sp. JSM 1782161]
MSVEPERSRILIVDDDPDTIQLLSSILSDQAEILFATSGSEGVTLAERHQPDVILLDQQMPGQSGYDTCQILTGNPLTRDCPIVFVTAQNHAGNEVKAFELGARDFISKPFKPVVVSARVRNQLVLKRQADALRMMLNHDGLTGVFNRRYFDQQFDTEIRRHQRQGLSLGLALIDVDHFKLFNDHYGHLAGDDCLHSVAQALERAVRRPGEFAARYGGEEFALVLPHLPAGDMAIVGERICNAVRGLKVPHSKSGAADHVTVSVGLVAGVPPDIQTRDYIRAGDEALYEAKGAGRNGYRVREL